MSRPVDDFVRVRETDFEAALHFSSGSQLVASTSYKITGDAARDRPFVGEVLAVGPGRRQPESGQRSSPPPCSPGDIVVTNLSSISYRLPAQAGVYLVRGPVIMAIVDRDTCRSRPVQHYVLVRSNDERTRRVISKGPIWIPTEALSTDDSPVRRSTNIVAAYGEVVAVGPGRWHEGIWQQPSCEPGQLVLYDASYATLPITIRGERMTLVDCNQVLQIEDEAPSLS